MSSQVRLMATILICVHAMACSKNRITDGDGNSYSFRVMADQKLWMTQNLNVSLPGSYCYDDQPENCKRYGRLYTYPLASEACSKLGNSWRLPTNEEWSFLAQSYGGIRDDNTGRDGKKAYEALILNGDAKFDVVLGGGREPNGSYEPKDAHGFYWTASEIDANRAWFYNLAKGGQLVNHHEGEKDRAISVRCIKIQ